LNVTTDANAFARLELVSVSHWIREREPASNLRRQAGTGVALWTIGLRPQSNGGLLVGSLDEEQESGLLRAEDRRQAVVPWDGANLRALLRPCRLAPDMIYHSRVMG
jgi:hypothetical protein